MTVRAGLWLLLGVVVGIAMAGGIAWYFAISLSDTTRAVLGTLGVGVLAQALAVMLGAIRATRDRQNSLADATAQRDRDRQDAISERLRQDELNQVRQTREWAFAGIDRCAALLDGNKEAAVAESARARALIDAGPVTFGSSRLHAEFEALMYAVRVVSQDAASSTVGPAIVEPVVADIKVAMLSLRDDIANALNEQRIRAQRGEPLRTETLPHPDAVQARIFELLHMVNR